MNVDIHGVTRRFGSAPGGGRGGPGNRPEGVFGLLGPNGAGKTTLLRMMATVITPSAGTLRLLGRDPGSYGAATGDPAPARVPAAELRLLPGVHRGGVRRVLRTAQGHAAGRFPSAVAAAVERVDLGGKARAKLRTLSGGMLRRAGIAQAIVNEPELLLLDEADRRVWTPSSGSRSGPCCAGSADGPP